LELPPTPPAADPVGEYARDVLAGKVVAGKYVRLACERHLRDIAEGGARGIRFDSAEAAAAIEFWEICPHLKGERASKKEDLRLEPWQKFIIGSIYGWRRVADGCRRYRIAWIEMGRKNGKTSMVYPAALHALTIDADEGGEIYSTATKKDQAKLVYQLARRAVSRVPEFAEVITSYVHSLVAEETFSKFEALGADADTLDGLNPSCVIADEIHKWRGRTLWDVIETGMGSRRQPLFLAITTAGEEGEEDVYGQEHGYTEQVLEGIIEDDSRFGYIAALDAGDDWRDPANFAKANPNLGVSVDPVELADAVRKAAHSPAAANAVKRLRLGIRTQDSDAWLPLPAWDSGKLASVDWELFRGADCGIGLDLASSCDFAAEAICFPVDDDMTPAREFDRPHGYLFRFRLWLPGNWQNPSEKRLREIVKPWTPDWIETTEGDVIDHDRIEAAVKADAELYRVRRLHYDPFNAAQLAVHLQNAGIAVEPFQQSMSKFAGPSKRFGEIVLGGRAFHEGSPCIRWMANNVVLVTNGAGHMMPSRKKSRNKIDGIVAGVMSLGACLNPGESSSIGSPLIL
jgi:phage terminase large subunit-like protein